tara:strand:+ start:5708 stop:6070 length:363 start_codon:yes stop_codon:yes gene_type:complete
MLKKNTLNNNDSILFKRKEDILCKVDHKNLKEENFVWSIFLLFKVSFFLLSIVSLIRISHITRIRISRLTEIKNSYIKEEIKYNKLTSRFDNLFSFDGQQRFMKDQDQMISRDVLRVIWR